MSRRGSKTSLRSRRRHPGKRQLGAFYTPPDVAAVIARHTLKPLLNGGGTAIGAAPLVLDPACGKGQLLVAVWRNLLSTCSVDSTADRVDLAMRCLHGVDVNPTAAAEARMILAAEVLQQQASTGNVRRLARHLRANIVVGDLILDGGVRTNYFPHAQSDPFDAVVMNPPFVNRRRQSSQFCRELLEFWPERFRTARGAYDLFVLFIERAWELLREGGRCGAMTPNKIATMSYAKACRELLANHSRVQWLIDAADVPLFDEAGVYPLIFGFEKLAASSSQLHNASDVHGNESVRVLAINDRASLGKEALASPTDGPAWKAVPLTQLEAKQWQLNSDLDVESRVPTLTADQIADWHVGTPGFGAQRIAKILVERGELEANAEAVPFIVSGNIHRFQVTRQPLRFMKQRWQHPVLDPQHPKLTPRQQELFTQPKVVVAGMGRRLRAAWDDVGRALGVQVYAATNLRVPQHYLLALLNSTLMTRIFRQRFGGQRLADNYLAVHKAQLLQLPIRAYDALCPTQQQLVSLSKQRSSLDSSTDDSVSAAIEARMDALVLKLYSITGDEFT